MFYQNQHPLHAKHAIILGITKTEKHTKTPRLCYHFILYVITELFKGLSARRVSWLCLTIFKLFKEESIMVVLTQLADIRAKQQCKEICLVLQHVCLSWNSQIDSLGALRIGLEKEGWKKGTAQMSQGAGLGKKWYSNSQLLERLNVCKMRSDFRGIAMWKKLCILK